MQCLTIEEREALTSVFLPSACVEPKKSNVCLNLAEASLSSYITAATCSGRKALRRQQKEDQL